MIKRQAIFFCGKNRFRNVQVLHIVYLIPLFPLQRQGFQFTFIQQCNHPKHLLVILIIAQSLSIRFQKGNIIRSGELFAELVDINRFVIIIYISVFKGFLRNKIDNIILLIQANHCSVHPSLVLCYQR